MIVFHKDKYFSLLVSLALLLFTAKLFFLHPTFSDENTYINMGKEVLNDKIPYKDFFFAHPPLQLYFLALIFKIFGVSFSTAKISCLVLSFLSVFFLYLIGREFLEERSAFLSSLLFLFWPGFLIFSGHEYGMWEIVFSFLLSIYLVLKNKVEFAAIVFSLATFFRYLILLYFPFILFLLYLKKKQVKKFFVYSFLSSITIFLILYFIFGFNFLNYSILFQISTKIFEEKLPKLVFQYLDLGYFSLFLAFLSSIFFYLKKNRVLLLLSIYPIAIDLLILILLKTVIYHYFLLSVPLIMLSIGNFLLEAKDKTLKILIIFIFFLSFYHNLPTFDFYLNPKSSESLIQIAYFVENVTEQDDAIFGEPVAMNYVSFVTNRRISANYLDSYPRHLFYEGEQKVLEKIKEDQPNIFINSDNIYFFLPKIKSYFLENYILVKSFSGLIGYEIYVKK